MASHVYEVAPDLEALQGGLAMAANEKTGSPQKNDDTSYVAVLAIIYTSLVGVSREECVSTIASFAINKDFIWHWAQFVCVSDLRLAFHIIFWF